jgi:Kef-type K+ transport system membrane component KefB
MTVFVELSIIMAIAALASFGARLLKQPLIVGYIFTGIFVGPYFLNILHSTEYIELFSKIGIATLLFIVGLSLNPFVVKEVGKVSVITALIQVVLTAVVGFFITSSFGFGLIPSIYVAIALTFSSTIIVLKLLSDKGDLSKLYGKISIGILLVQDIIATMVLVVISTMSLSESSGILEAATFLILKGIIVITILFTISKSILPTVSRLFAASPELLFIFSLAWGFGVSAIFAWLGFSIEIGALIAGVALSLSPFSYEIGARIKPLRDFFIILFFILLGSQLIVEDIGKLLIPALTLSAFVLIGKPIIVYLIMNVLGYKRKTEFEVGLTLSQISEFSLILASLVLSIGAIDSQVVSLITLVGIITIAGSTYLVQYSEPVYFYMDKFLRLFSIKRKTTKHHKSIKGSEPEVVLFGYDRVGMDFVKEIEKLEKPYLVVDFNPNSINKLKDANLPFRYGDAEDIDFLDELEFQNIRLVISTMPDFNANMLLVKSYRRLNLTGIIIVISHDVDQARQLYLNGASYVVMPHYLGAHHAASMVSKYGFNIEEFERERNNHLNKLSKKYAV